MTSIPRILKCVDLKMSFDPLNESSRQQSVIDCRGRRILGYAVWIAGNEAVALLTHLENCPVGELVLRFPRLVRELEEFLETALATMLKCGIDEGFSSEQGCGEQRVPIQQVWARNDTVGKVHSVLQLMLVKPREMYSQPDRYLERCAAIASLLLLDDCAHAASCGGVGLDQAAFRLGQISSFMQPPSLLLHALTGAKKQGENETQEAVREAKAAIGKAAADARHSLPGGARDKVKAIRAIWASGKYSSRDRCADEEHAALDWSRNRARNALIGTPEPPGHEKPPCRRAMPAKASSPVRRTG